MKGSTVLRRCSRIEDPDMRHRIRKGVRLLNRTQGNYWPSEIDLDTFSISDPWRCVLGQLRIEDNYIRSAYRLGLEGDGVVSHGFEVGDEDDYYSDLQDAWVLVLGGKSGI